MTLDMQTLDHVRYQARRRTHCLSLTPPDRVEAERCMARIDEFLDRRPRPFAVAGDGEIIMSDASPWVLAQVAIDAVVPDPVCEACNTMLTDGRCASCSGEAAGNGRGGTAVLDRDDSAGDRLGSVIDGFRKQLGYDRGFMDDR